MLTLLLWHSKFILRDSSQIVGTGNREQSNLIYFYLWRVR